MPSTPYPRKPLWLLQKDIDHMPTVDGYGFFQSNYKGVVEFLVGILKYSSKELSELCRIVKKIDNLSSATNPIVIDRREKMSKRAVFLKNRLIETVESTSVDRIFPEVNTSLPDPVVPARTVYRKSYNGSKCLNSPVSIPTDGQTAVNLLETEIDNIVQEAINLLATVGL